MAKTVEIGPYSAYALAVAAGFVGTEEEWLKSLIGPQGEQGASITDVKINGEGHIIVTVHDPVSGEDSTIDAGDIGTVEAVEGVNAAIRQAAEQAVAAVTAQQATSVGAVQAAQSTGVQAVQQAQSTATGVVGDAQTSAVQAVNKARDEALSQVETSTEAAEQAKDAAASSAAAAAGSATDAAASKTAAATSATQAAEAKTGADSAKAAAETAQQAAESAKDSAEVAQSKAEQAETNAQSAAGEIDAGLIVETASGETITIRDSAAAKLRGLRLYGKSVQDGTPTPESPVEIQSAGDGGSITTQVRGANLLSIPDTNITHNGITFISSGGIVKISGTSTAEANMRVNFSLPIGTYYISGNVSAGSCRVAYKYNSEDSYTYCVGPASFTLIKPTYEFIFQLIVSNGSTVNETVYPMINVGSTALPWEPYKSQTLTYPTPNGLPGIPVEDGGNYTDSDGQQWICDEVDFGRGKYIQRITSSPIVSGDLLNLFESSQYGNYVTTSKAYKYVADVCTVMSPMFLGIKFEQRNLSPNLYRVYVDGYGNSTLTFRFPIGTVSSMEDARNLFTDNQVTVIAVLVTPIETNLTPEQLEAYAALTTYKPNTTVTTDSSPAAGIEVNYVADTKTYIDNKLAAISEVILGGTKNGNV